MFSGIISNKLIAKKSKSTESGAEYSFTTPRGWGVREGDSIAIDGICSTVASLSKDTFSVFWMPETIRKTSISTQSANHEFNLEQPLTLNRFIDGHLLSGHVDTTAKVTGIVADGEAKTITFAIDAAFSRYIIYKGSIAINGVSLTIVSIKDNVFSVSLIPYTLQNTNLGDLKVKDSVNIEVDMIAKYVEKITSLKSTS